MQRGASIKSTTLILTAENDHPTSKRQAYQLKLKLKKEDTLVALVEFKGEGHVIPFEKRNPVIDEFLKKSLSGVAR